MKILFCNIAWMKYYQGVTEEDIPINGGSYVKEKHTAIESTNFFPITITEEGDDEEERTVLLGSYETMSTFKDTINQTHIENIDGCQTYAKEPSVDDILVVWCATQPSKESRVIGWYKNATVFRQYKGIPIDYEDGSTEDRWFNIMTDINEAVLLPEEERNRNIWKAPRKNIQHGTPYGFFRANVWYAHEPEAQNFIKKLVDNINNYNGENAINIQ